MSRRVSEEALLNFLVAARDAELGKAAVAVRELEEQKAAWSMGYVRGLELSIVSVHRWARGQDPDPSVR